MTNILKIGKSEEQHNGSLPFFLLWVYSMGIMKNTNTTTYIKDDRISMQMQQSHWKNDAEYVALVEDLIYHEELLHMETITHHHFTNRLEHSIRVSYKSYQLAKKWKLDAGLSNTMNQVFFTRLGDFNTEKHTMKFNNEWTPQFSVSRVV